MIRRYLVTGALDGHDVLAVYVDEYGGHRELVAPYVLFCPHCVEPVAHTVQVRIHEVLPAVSGGTQDLA